MKYFQQFFITITVIFTVNLDVAIAPVKRVRELNEPSSSKKVCIISSSSPSSSSSPETSTDSYIAPIPKALCLREELSDPEFERNLATAGDKLVVIIFNRKSARQSIVSEISYNELGPKYPNVKFISVIAEVCPKTINKYHVQSFPQHVFVKNSVEVSRLYDCTLNFFFKTLSRHCN